LIELSPSLVLATWAAGLAASAALVVSWRVVGPGFVWLATAVTAMFGLGGWWAGAGWESAAACGLLAGVAFLARRSQAVFALLAASAVLFAAGAARDGGWLLTISGGLALGGVTTEMMLGHWFLIDPQLPRWSLHRLVVVGLAGIGADVGFIVADAGLEFESAVIPATFATLAAATIALMILVWFALIEPGYSGVMAATGLSYLATLTVVGAVVAGRAFLEGAPNLVISILAP
jgi:hypothetical protein